MDRDYVIVCNRHKGISGSLLFWGRLTEDTQERSFGGYTSNFNGCEKYTLDEIKESGYNFNEYEGNKNAWRNFSDFYIKIDQLKELGYRPMLIYYS